MFGQSHIVAAVFCLLASIGWVLQVAGGGLLYKKVWDYKKNNGDITFQEVSAASLNIHVSPPSSSSIYILCFLTVHLSPLRAEASYSPTVHRSGLPFGARGQAILMFRLRRPRPQTSSRRTRLRRYCYIKLDWDKASCRITVLESRS